MGIKSFLHRATREKRQREEFEGQQRIQERFQEKKISANERELMKLKESDRQERIKRELNVRRKREQRDFFEGKKHNAVNTPNIVKDKKDLFPNKNMFSNVQNINKQKRLFYK